MRNQDTATKKYLQQEKRIDEFFGNEKLSAMLKNQKRELRGRERRWRRLVLTGRSAVYHVMSRVSRRQFWLGDEERDVLVAMMRKQAVFTGVEVLSYCMMGNHFHMLIHVPECPVREDGNHLIDDAELLRRYKSFYGDQLPVSAWSCEEFEAIINGDDPILAETERRRVLIRMGNLSAFVREIKHRFTLWFNHRHENTGTIWSARFKSVLVEDAPEVLTKVAAYIDLNPVRAQIVIDPGDYRWCGYACALAGDRTARSGLEGLYGTTERFPYQRVIPAYRLILFGKGASSKGTENKDLGVIDPDRVRSILDAGGEVTLAEALRCRIRYFSDGGALGSRQFLDACLAENRDRFSPRRKRSGAPMKGSFWSGLCSTRRLVKRIWS